MPPQFAHPIDFSWTAHEFLSQITHIPVAVRTNNLGDDIQSLAMQMLAGFTDEKYVDRDSMSKWPRTALIPMCGWYGYGDFETKADVVVVSFHCREASRRSLAENREWLADQVKQQGFPAMCRDLSTRDFVRGLGIDAEFGGCVTLTIPASNATRKIGDLVIEDHTYPINSWDHQYNHLDGSLMGMDAKLRMMRAKRQLDVLASASSVTTSKLHVWLPCIALGTPCDLNLAPSIPEQIRFTGYLDQT